MNALKIYVVALTGLFVLFAASAVQAFSWAPINPDELKMTAEPKAPGASAIILEKQVDRDDADNKVSVYMRYKILTEAGRDFGNVEIHYDKDRESISYIQARTIKSDGEVIEFNGKIFDKLIVKARGIKYQAKTFSLPDVQVGSIVEFRYLYYLPSYYVYDSKWVLSEELFVKHASYSLWPNQYFGLRWSWPRGLPAGTKEPVEKGGKIRLETVDVPAFVVEDYMPPEDELKYRVDFVYQTRASTERVPLKYWLEIGKQINKEAENFMDQHKAMERAVTKIIQPDDSNDNKLRKIYAHVQKLRNLSYEQEKTEEEQKRDKTKERADVADVEKYGYGSAFDLTYLYVALARAAGFKADMVFVPTRDRYFFEPKAMNPNQLTSNVAVVTVDGKELYIEPGVPFVPFGMLPWYEFAVPGLRLDKQGGTWLTVPSTKPAQSQTTRKAILKLDGGDLEGIVNVTYTGLEAIAQRIEERFDDATARKTYMENELKSVVPTGCYVEVTNSPDWNGVETPLIVEYKVKIPGWASSAGKRLLMPLGLFSANEKHTFEQEQRLHPIYFHYPNITEDEINIELPETWQITSLPKSHDDNIAIATFSASAESKGNTVRINRNLTINGIFVPEKYYLALREFFQNARISDEEQVVLTPVTSTSAAKPAVKAH